MREAGETCSVHRVARIMRETKLKSQIGYKRRYIKGGKLANVAANVLGRNFNPDEPNQASRTMRIFSSVENLRRVLRRISLTVFSVFDMLIVKLLCFSLKAAEVSLSESGHLVPWWLTPHNGQSICQYTQEKLTSTYGANHGSTQCTLIAVVNEDRAKYISGSVCRDTI
jgi:hypothetical protein